MEPRDKEYYDDLDEILDEVEDLTVLSDIKGREFGGEYGYNEGLDYDSYNWD